MFDIFEIANNSLKTQRTAMELATGNVVNSLTPGYKAKSPLIGAKHGKGSFSDIMASMANDHDRDGVAQSIIGDDLGKGTQVVEVMEDQTAGAMVHMPDHPMADKDGNVEMSNVDAPKEMLKMMEAVRQYKANLTIVEMAKKAAQEAMNMNKNA